MTEGNIYFQIARDRQKQAFQEAREELGRQRDIDPDELTRPEVVAESARLFATLGRLRRDDRYQSTAEHIAEDYDMESDEISDKAVLTTALACYNGYETGRDWPVEP